MQMKTLLLVVLMSVSSVALAAVSSKGTATVTYTGLLTVKVRQEALQKAKVNALDRYFSEVNQAKARNYELVREKLVASVDEYVLGATTLAESEDKKLRNYSITVRVDINGPKLENALQNSSSVANATAAEKSLMTFVFVARQQRSATSFDDRVTTRKDNSKRDSTTYDEKSKTSETERVRRTGVSTSDSIEESTDGTRDSSTVTTTGGKTVRQSDDIEWSVTRASEINTVMTGTFTNAGFEVVEAEYVEQESNGLLSVDAIRQDYSHGDDLAPLTQRNMVNGVKAAGIPFIAIGTLDVGMRDTDPATGNKRVFVTVSGKVLDLSQKFPRTVSSVGPVQFSGLGPDESVARVNALKKAAESAAQQLMNELNAKGVK
jgi:hypothetical protein